MLGNKKIILFFTSILLSSTAIAKQDNIVIYNSGNNSDGYGFVSLYRDIDIKIPKQKIRFGELLDDYKPDTLIAISLTDKNTKIISQEYQESQYILQSMIGKMVNIIMIGATKPVSGKIINSDNSNTTILNNDKITILTNSNIAEITLANNDYINQKYVDLTIDSKKTGTHNMLFNYKTSALSWRPHYKLIITEENGEDVILQLQADALITNNDKNPLKDVKLELIAGNVGASFNPRELKMALSSDMNTEQSNSSSDYQIYDIKDNVTIGGKTTLRTAIIETKEGIKATKILESSNHDYNRVKRKIIIPNTTQNNMDIAMPSGLVDAYNKQDNKIMFIGQLMTQNIEKGGEISLEIGESFNVTTKREITQTRTTNEGKNREEDVVITISNKNNIEEKIKLIEDGSYMQDWKIINESMKYNKITNNNVEFVVKLNPNETKIISFTVRTSN
jgi:hypothetical protein